ncbi:flavin reductase family protein [Patulibacter defluvii]|uniref:flavin reductase family protein n=1 Tax=Patulibacter defluvii TaxID=3095358 RepID=UPI002A759265|nr:flavin reductase family protein [Patulibacter sp. DM4]
MTDADRRIAYRRCVGAFATGVTVVTARADDERAGMTLNAFTSVSLDPLLVCVCLAHGTRTLDVVRRAGSFAVSVLEASQQDVALAFARPGSPFPGEHVEEAGGQLPVAGALAVLRCELEQLVAAGDHDVAIGRVVDFESRDGAPLVFHQGAFAAVRG